MTFCYFITGFDTCTCVPRKKNNASDDSVWWSIVTVIQWVGGFTSNDGRGHQSFFFVLIGITQWSTRTRNFMSLMRNISSGLRWGGDGVAGKWELAVTDVNSKLMALPICGGGDHRREGEITTRESAIRQLYFDKNVCNFTFDASKEVGKQDGANAQWFNRKIQFQFQYFSIKFLFWY